MAVFSHTLNLIVRGRGVKETQEQFSKAKNSSRQLRQATEDNSKRIDELRGKAVRAGTALQDMAKPVKINVDSSSVNQAQQEAGKTGGWSRLVAAAGTAGKVIAGVGTAVVATATAIRLLPTAIDKATAAWAEQEAAVNRVSIALKASRQFSEQEAASLQAFASQIQSQTRFGDEEILRNIALISQLSGAVGQELREATAIAVDFAAVTGRGMQTASLLVAKALQNQTSELSRYGITISETIPTAQRGAAALAKMREQFGGTAAADVKTLQGATFQLKNTMGDLDEQIQRVLANALNLPGVIAVVEAAARKLTAAIEGQLGPTVEGIEALFDAFRDGELSEKEFRVAIRPFVDNEDIQVARAAVASVGASVEFDAGADWFSQFKATAARRIAQEEFQVRVAADARRAEATIEELRVNAVDDLVIAAEIVLGADPIVQQILAGGFADVPTVNLALDSDAAIREAKGASDEIEAFLQFRARIIAEIPTATIDDLKAMRADILAFGVGLKTAGDEGKFLVPLFAALKDTFDGLAVDRVASINVEAKTAEAEARIAALQAKADAAAKIDQEQAAKAQLDISQIVEGVDFADAKLREFTEAERNIRLHVELEEFDAAAEELDRLRALAEEFPDDLEIRVRVTRAEASLKSLEKSSKDVDNIWKKLNFDPAAQAMSLVLTRMTTDADQATKKVLDAFKQMVADITVQLLKLAALEILKLVLQLVSGGTSSVVESGLGGFGGITKGAAPGGSGLLSPGTGSSAAPFFAGAVPVSAVDLQGLTLNIQQRTPRPVDSFLEQPAGVVNYNFRLNETATLLRSVRSGALRDVDTQLIRFARGG